MRIPVITLAAILCLNGPLSAAPGGKAPANDLPKWTTVEEPWGTWRPVWFVDAAGKRHDVWCRWSECGSKVKQGTAPLYEFARGASAEYDYKDPRTGRTSKSSKTHYATKLSHYSLKVTNGAQSIVLPGSDKTFTVNEDAQLTPLGYVVIVSAPAAMAADAPAKPGKQPAGKQPAGKQPVGKKPAGKKPAGKQPATAPVGKLVPLTEREKAWLSETERSIYDIGMKDSTADDADKAKVAAQYRELLGKTGLPQEFRADYALLAPKQDPAAIDAFLLNIVEITGAQLTGLEKIVKGKEPAGYKLTKDNARQDYEAEMLPLAKDAGHPAAAESRKAYAITAKYRAMLKASGSAAAPNPDPANPGGTPAPAPTSLSAREAAALTAEERAAYEKELAAAGKDPAKIADVLKKYRTIAAKRDTEVFKSLGPDEKADLCKPFKTAAAQGTAADSQNAKEMGGTGNARSQLDQTAASLTGGAATSAPQPPSATAGFSEPVHKACLEFLAGAKAPTGPLAGPTVPPSPGMKPGTSADPNPKKKEGIFDSMSKETSANLRAGAVGAILGLLIGSLFGPGGAILGAAIGGAAFFGANYAMVKMP
ncbi:MAG: hypothetical protein HY079_05385 [Elusimicrobia bacterium]|nr:hypothetical protein [Elusimicrobiota bacterium]